MKAMAVDEQLEFLARCRWLAGGTASGTLVVAVARAEDETEPPAEFRFRPADDRDLVLVALEILKAAKVEVSAARLDVEGGAGGGAE